MRVHTLSDRDASRTALATAYLRAAHQLLDTPPLILEDRAVLPMLGARAAEKILGLPDRYQFPEARALRSHVVLRSRFAEERLSAAVQRGVAQYVILGAGFDTFAFRQPDWAKPLTIVEVDHAATQALKRSRIADSKLAIPPNVSLACIDFERESSLFGLSRQGVRFDMPTFFSWLGVTMYLDERAIDATLQAIATSPPGSEIVLTFMQPFDSASDSSVLAERVSGIGEPFVSCFEPEEILAKLRMAGFTQAALLTPEEARLRYYAGRTEDIPPPTRTGIAYAIR